MASISEPVKTQMERLTNAGKTLQTKIKNAAHKNERFMTKIIRVIYFLLAAFFFFDWHKLDLARHLDYGKYHDPNLAFGLFMLGLLSANSMSRLGMALMSISFWVCHSPALTFFFLVAVLVAQEST